MRNGIAIFLLLILGCPYMGIRAFLLLRKQAIKEEVKAWILAGADKNELVHFVFSKKDIQTKLRWEHAREFEYKGEMYDVVESEERGDSTAYWCIQDHAETQLNRHLAALTANAANHDPPSQSALQQLFNFLKNLFPSTRSHHAGVSQEHVAISYFYQPLQNLPTSAPLTPPPETRFSTMEYY